MLEKASNGLKIKMLMMHEENPALLQMIYEKTGVSVEKVRSDIKFNFKTFSEIAEKSNISKLNAFYMEPLNALLYLMIILLYTCLTFILKRVVLYRYGKREKIHTFINY